MQKKKNLNNNIILVLMHAIVGNKVCYLSQGLEQTTPTAPNRRPGTKHKQLYHIFKPIFALRCKKAQVTHKCIIHWVRPNRSGEVFGGKECGVGVDLGNNEVVNIEQLRQLLHRQIAFKTAVTV
jgi:hypothetical protein